mmetsp:Transcript_11192/g.45090  ORF Transcript_11192/g.45090 Transcript_11192/m.45090 type:complete len:349 (-) Transcript_11192:101-1147(-)
MASRAVYRQRGGVRSPVDRPPRGAHPHGRPIRPDTLVHAETVGAVYPPHFVRSVEVDVARVGVLLEPRAVLAAAVELPPRGIRVPPIIHAHVPESLRNFGRGSAQVRPRHRRLDFRIHDDFGDRFIHHALLVLLEHREDVLRLGVHRDVERRPVGVGFRARREQRVGADGQIVGRHPVQRGVAVGVRRGDVGSAGDEVFCGVLIGPRHPARVQRRRPSGRDVVDEVGVRVEELRERRIRLRRARPHLGVEFRYSLRDGRVTSAAVHRPRPRVVALVLPPDHDAAVSRALHRAAVDSRPNAVRVRVEAVRIRLARSAVFCGHPRRVRVMGDLHSIFAIVRRRHRGAAGC